MSLKISCKSCSDQHKKEINYEFLKEVDDLIIYKCPECNNEILYDEFKIEYINLANWLFKNKKKMYHTILKEYFESLLFDI